MILVDFTVTSDLSFLTLMSLDGLLLHGWSGGLVHRGVMVATLGEEGADSLLCFLHVDYLRMFGFKIILFEICFCFV